MAKNADGTRKGQVAGRYQKQHGDRWVAYDRDTDKPLRIKKSDGPYKGIAKK